MKISRHDALGLVALMIFFSAGGALVFGSWYLYRRFNYKFGYESLVGQQIKNAVKDTCLK